jgi:hypothetical protein
MEDAMTCECLSNRIIDSLISIGKAQQYLEKLLKEDIFTKTKNLDEDTRIQIDSLSDNLWYLKIILRGQDRNQD